MSSVNRPPDAPLDVRTVLVPLDGSAGAERALPTAEWLARHLDADLHVIAADVSRTEAFRSQHYLDELQARHPEVAAAHRSDDTDVAHAVHEAARRLGPAVVCLATHGRGRAAALLGSTFAAIAASGTTPIVAVGPRATQVPSDAAGRIVACVDGSTASATVVPDAAAWARRLGLTLSVATVAEPAPRPWQPTAERQRAFGPPGDPQEYLAALSRDPALAGVEFDAIVLWDPIGPDAGLFDHLEARPATLLAVSSHARTGLARVLAGSEAARIVHGSPVPVLVRPIPTAA